MDRIVLISSNDDYEVRLRRIAGGIDVAVSRPPVAVAEPDTSLSSLMSARPSVVVVGPDLDVALAQHWTELLDEHHPAVTVVWVAQPAPETWRVALRAGARDLISPDEADAEVEATMSRALNIRDRRIDVLAAPVELGDLALGGSGRLITVVSPKGGSGKTMFSTNLAYGLSQKTERSVVLVDLDLQFGDVAGALHIRPEYSVLNGLKAAGDPTAVKAFLNHHAQGFYVLAAPNNPADADEIDFDGLAKLLDLLRNEFDYVVVDTGAGLDETTLTALDVSTDVAFITSTDLAAIQALRKAVLVLDQLRITDHRRWYILNRSDARVGLARSDIESSTGLAIDVAVPSSRVVPAAMNQGVAVLEDDPRSNVARALDQAVDLFSSTGGPQKRQAGNRDDSTRRVGRWFGKGTP
jgi:pilus assembly protein CpaE